MDKEQFRFVAPCLFGIEGILADELRRMDALDVEAQDGRVYFSGDINILARANINSRYAERILLVLGEFEARTFTELFDRVTEIPLEKYISPTDAFPVKGKSRASKLFSVSDCQSIIKKAAVTRLGMQYNTDWFEETGETVQLQFFINKDNVVLMVDTSGDGLHKRGYRKNATDAPLKETIAAAMAYTARLYPDTQLYDPFCGSGTILIEAAMMACNIAPGLNRSFAAEKFIFSNPDAWREERARAIGLIDKSVPFMAYGSDIDPYAVELTMSNAVLAGVGEHVSATVGDVRDFTLPEETRALVITNPPYGERLLDADEARVLIEQMGKVMPRQKGKRYYIISPSEEFETVFGRPADKRRKLYNGMIKCQLYMYFR